MIRFSLCNLAQQVSRPSISRSCLGPKSFRQFAERCQTKEKLKQDWKISPKCDQILENTEYANKGKRVKLNKKEKQSKMPNLA